MKFSLGNTQNENRIGTLLQDTTTQIHQKAARSLEHEHGRDHGSHRERGLCEARLDLGRGARRRRRRRCRSLGGDRGLFGGEDVDLDLHAVLAVRADVADEPPPASLGERHLVLAGAHHLGVLRDAARREVGAVDLHHRVAGLVVLEH